MKKIVTILLVTGVLFSSVSLTTFANAKDYHAKKKVEYVSLGDSIAAGLTPYGSYDLSFADYLRDHFKRSNHKVVDYDNFAVSGYTSDQLRNDILNNESVRKEIKEATHITIDIGLSDVFRMLLTDPSRVSEAIDSASANLQIILSTIDDLNPNVDVYVLGYYNPYPYAPQPGQGKMLEIVRSLNSEIKLRTEANGDTYVSTEEIIAKNYQKYMPNPDDNHINIKGHKVIAKELWKATK
ncbi:GDSL-type esterase/lipase family protein [Hazenella coriacea]|uniref:Lysophospholipase L1-like esterase n=1 Tax=Hazenella coriacea TaxID=1179467 RepID=A0A4R3L6E2_9BACL|nr:GDSL-type esterase/lipase family protein [Hazenella coriacea]TCS95441.1 lysophospholipase L1-like esterase [Hazenella coriacea]